MSLRTILTSVATAVVALSFVPVLAFAQSYNTNCGNNWFPYWNNSTTNNCTPGNLLVYVEVTNNTGYGNTAVSSNFTVSVSGASASPTSFPGSLTGTPVMVAGNYSVNAASQPGYTATYSQGCNGTLVNSQSATCIVTESNTNNYNNYPSTYYPNQYYPSYQNNYGYYTAPLVCTPSGQTVTIGQSVTFTAQGGGDVSQFNWSNSAQPNSTSYNIGRTYTTQFLSPGTTNVLVTNGSQNATCTVNVVGYPVVGYNYPGATVTPSNTYPVNGVYPNSTYPVVTVTPTYIPSLPNTGYAPVSASELAIVFAFLVAAALVVYPYVRQAFSIVLR